MMKNNEKNIKDDEIFFSPSSFLVLEKLNKLYVFLKKTLLKSYIISYNCKSDIGDIHY